MKKNIPLLATLGLFCLLFVAMPLVAMVKVWDFYALIVWGSLGVLDLVLIKKLGLVK